MLLVSCLAFVRCKEKVDRSNELAVASFENGWLKGYMYATLNPDSNFLNGFKIDSVEFSNKFINKQTASYVLGVDSNGIIIEDTSQKKPTGRVKLNYY